jgi:hypothetical protein
VAALALPGSAREQQRPAAYRTDAVQHAPWLDPASAPLGPASPSASPPAAPQASSLSYGISSDYLTYADTPQGQRFAAAVLGRSAHVRISVAYDALAYWDGHACAASPAARAGATAWSKLKRLLTRARTDGLNPEVVFAEGTGIGGVPVTPDPADPVQATDYRCGVRGLMQTLFTDAGQYQMPAQFEAWNEPDNDGYSHGWDQNCPSPAQAAPSCSGPWRAAMLWYIAQAEANSLYEADSGAGFPPLTVAALTISAPEKLYFLDAGHLALSAPDGQAYNGYYQSLYRIVHCAPGFGGCQQGPYAPTAMPTAWAVHDYDDPTAGGTADLQAFEAALAQLNDAYASGAGAQVWITEGGVQLDSSVTSDLNLPAGLGCPASNLRADNAGTLGCRQDNRPENQAAGATVWRSLGTLSHPTASGQIAVSQLYWYQFQLPALRCTLRSPCKLGHGVVYDSGQVLPTLHAWDSALVDSTGSPRASFCVLTSTPVSSCGGKPHDYAASRWYHWWQYAEMPAACPAHYGAWVADNAGSGLPNGEECWYDPASPPAGLGGTW